MNTFFQKRKEILSNISKIAYALILLILIVIIIFACYAKTKIGYFTNIALLLAATYLLLPSINGDICKKENNIWHAWAVACGLILLGTYFIYLNCFNNDTANFYILSTITQSLASLFAILFVLFIALSQKGDMEYIFPPSTFVYITLFISSIVAPILIINNQNVWFIRVSVNASIWSVAMLLPFIWRFKVRYPKPRDNESIELLKQISDILDQINKRHKK